MASGGKNWSLEETEYLLNIIKDKKIVKRLDRRKVINSNLFKEVFEEMQFGGFNRSVEQIQNRCHENKHFLGGSRWFNAAKFCSEYMECTRKRIFEWDCNV